MMYEEHIDLTRQRLTITLDIPPPVLVVEAVSPYRSVSDRNYQRDYVDKRQQYQDRGIPEYWIIDNIDQTITLQVLEQGIYQAAELSGDQRIMSQIFPSLSLTAAQILQAH